MLTNHKWLHTHLFFRVKPDNSWFEGKGSVRDLAKVFQQQIQEHDFYQSVLDGKLGQDQQDGELGKGLETLLSSMAI